MSIEELNKQDPPEIYVTCLSCEERGLTHGAWIRADQEVEHLEGDIFNMLSFCQVVNESSRWTINDIDNFGALAEGFDEFKNCNLNKISQWAILISQAEDRDAAACFIKWAEERNIPVTLDEFRCRYRGHWTTRVDFARDSGELEETYRWEEFEKTFPFWADCIDWEKAARNVEHTDEYSFECAQRSKGHGVYVFAAYPAS